MKNIRAYIVTMLVAMSVISVNAEVVELGLLLDGSGSMRQAGWDAQIQAYEDIFQDDFFTNIVTPGDELHVTVYQFSNNVVREIDLTHIDSDATAAAFGAQIGAFSWMDSITNTSNAVNDAAAYLLGNGLVSDRMILDVSTDGVPYGGGANPIGRAIQAAEDAAAEGITVNAIGIGQNITESFLDDFTSAGNGFYVIANGFDEFKDSLRTKLAREIQATPEPSSYALMLIGLFGLIMIRRRRDVAIQA
ncbi:MAG: DUF1194 domain-containing protein [Lentisphaeraceae bacterium]|nr:DUF1194 domain-containing protein [Lentisphaeraceae bacterium]